MKKLFPILTGFTFAAGVLVGGYIVSIILDKSLNPRTTAEDLARRWANPADEELDLSDEEAEELYDSLNREIDEEVLKEYDEGHSS